MLTRKLGGKTRLRPPLLELRSFRESIFVVSVLYMGFLKGAGRALAPKAGSIPSIHKRTM